MTKCLGPALDQGDPCLIQLLVDPSLDPLRDVLRFRALLRQDRLAN